MMRSGSYHKTRSRMRKKERIIITLLYVSYFMWITEGKPQLYSCNLKITNDSIVIGEYDCNHDFDISDDGAKIPNDGIEGYLTSDPGCACNDVETPHNFSKGWAAVVQYGSNTDCSIKNKVSLVTGAEYRMILLVASTSCGHGGNESSNYGEVSTIPIIYAQSGLANALLAHSKPSSEIDYAAKVRVEAVYVDFALLWTVFGVTVAITITSTICCFCIFFVFRGLAAKFRRQGLSRWSLRKLTQRKYVKGKEIYETCAICLEEFENADTIRVLPCSHIYHSKCVDEWLMKWNRVCPVCKRVILRNERGEDQVETEEIDSTSPEPAATSASSADNISDSRTVESIPLLVTVHDSTDSRTHRYGSVAENSGEGTGGQYLLESFAAMENDVLSQQTEEPEEVASNNLPTVESHHTVTV